MFTDILALAVGAAGLTAEVYFVVFMILPGESDSFMAAQCIVLVLLNLVLMACFKGTIIGMRYLRVIMQALIPVLALSSCATLAFALSLLAFGYANVDQVLEILTGHYRNILWYYKMFVHYA